MGPFLYVIAAAALAVGAAAGVEPRATPTPGDVVWANLFAAFLVGAAAGGGARQARLRVAAGGYAGAVSRFERLHDFAGYALLLFGTEFPAVVSRAVPGATVDVFVVFAPCFTAAAARFAAALRVDPEIAAEKRPFAPEFRLAVRLLLAPVLPFLALDAVVSTVAAIPSCAVAFATYPSLTAATGVAAVVLGAGFSPLLFRVLFGARPFDAGDPLRAECEDLARRARFPLDYLGRVDTGFSLPNAAYLGLGRPWRTVLFTDALLAALGPAERRAVFAHELGHGVRRHLAWFVLGLATATVGVHAFSAELEATAASGAAHLRDAGLSAEDAAGGGAAAAFALASIAVLGGLTLLFGFVSRRFETEADLFASDLAGGPEPFAEALTTVAARIGAPERDGFRHFGVPRRIAFVRRAAAEPAFRRAFERRMIVVRAAIALLALATAARWAAAWPAERAGAPERAAEARLEFCDDALVEGDFAAAALHAVAAEASGAPRDPRRDVNRAHAAARLAALGLATSGGETNLDGEAFGAAVDRLREARRAFSEAEAANGALATPDSVAATDREIRFLAALAGRGPAVFEAESFASERLLAAIRGGPEVVPPDDAARARRESTSDDAWRREALFRRVDVRAALAARYPGLCDNDDG